MTKEEVALELEGKGFEKGITSGGGKRRGRKSVARVETRTKWEMTRPLPVKLMTTSRVFNQ